MACCDDCAKSGGSCGGAKKASTLSGVHGYWSKFGGMPDLAVNAVYYCGDYRIDMFIDPVTRQGWSRVVLHDLGILATWFYKWIGDAGHDPWRLPLPPGLPLYCVQKILSAGGGGGHLVGGGGHVHTGPVKPVHPIGSGGGSGSGGSGGTHTLNPHAPIVAAPGKTAPVTAPPPGAIQPANPVIAKIRGNQVAAAHYGISEGTKNHLRGVGDFTAPVAVNNGSSGLEVVLIGAAGVALGAYGAILYKKSRR